jgi:hypothetical protein
MTEYVYFIRAGDEGGPVKIGRTRDVQRRLAALQTASAETLHLIGFVHGDATTELALHEEFRDEMLRGEWIAASPRLTAKLEKLDGIFRCNMAALAGAKSAPSDDPHTAEARGWAAYVEDRLSEETGKSLRVVRPVLGQHLGVAPGLLENLRRGRVAAITARDYFLLRSAYTAEKQRALDALREQLSEVAEVETRLAEIRQALIGERP